MGRQEHRTPIFFLRILIAPPGNNSCEPRYPPPFVVESGDTIALDMLVSADGKQKIVDYIELSNKPSTGPEH